MPCKSTDLCTRAGRCSIERRHWDPGGIAKGSAASALSWALHGPFAGENKVVTPSGLTDHQQIQASGRLRRPFRGAAPFDHRVLADEMSCKHFCAFSVVLAQQIAFSSQLLSRPERGSLVAANSRVAQSSSG